MLPASASFELFVLIDCTSFMVASGCDMIVPGFFEPLMLDSFIDVECSSSCLGERDF